MRELLFASNNAKKYQEISALFQPLGVRVIAPAEVGLSNFDVEETGKTFEDNAALKAITFASKSGLPTFGDDSGLSVDALDGNPGVFSKRFFPGSDTDRNIHLLELLAGEENRAAHFTTVICFSDPLSKTVQFFNGKVYGTIAESIRGTAGFGYDPIFIPDGYTQTFGELGSAVKLEQSHRARAVQKFITYLQTTSKEKESV